MSEGVGVSSLGSPSYRQSLVTANKKNAANEKGCIPRFHACSLNVLIVITLLFILITFWIDRICARHEFQILHLSSPPFCRLITFPVSIVHNSVSVFQ